MSFVLAKAQPGTPLAELAERIRKATGLRALSQDDFGWMTIGYYMQHTGIPVNFGLTVAIGLIVGTVVAGQTFYIFTIENLKQFGALKAIGTTNLRIVGMILLQALLVGAVGYSIGMGMTAVLIVAVAAQSDQLTGVLPFPCRLSGLMSRREALLRMGRRRRSSGGNLSTIPNSSRSSLEPVAANLDLQLAAARVAEARANRGLARSNGLPQVTAAASGARNRQMVLGIGPGPFPFETNLYQGQFDMSWEADVFGRIRRQVEGATADLAAQEEDRRNVLIALLGDVATNYAQVRGFQLRLDIAQRNIRIQEDTLDLTRVLAKAGQATDRDVAQAEAQSESRRAAVPQLETGRDQSIHRLGVLLGSEPGSLVNELSGSSPLPVAPAAVPVGLPSELLKRRPDIRRAEAQLAAATAHLGEAKADYFPKFSLTGLAGRESTQLSLLPLGVGNIFSAGPSISLPIFTAGRIRANVAVQEARVKQAVDVYRSTVLRALEETKDALVAYSNEQERRDRLERVIAADRTALDLARVQYQAGLADFLTVLDAERALSEHEDQLAQSQTSVITGLVSLYKALGGGWAASLSGP